MHSVWQRLNAVLTFSVLILAGLCAVTSFSDTFNSPTPTADIQVLRINRFQKQSSGNDEISLSMKISADLRSLFTWNTKQVFVFLAAEYETSTNSLNQISLWDRIIQSKEESNFSVKTPNKYRLTDQGSNLRGKDFNMTLHWHVMPKTGKMSANKIVLPGYRFPEEYK